MDSFFDLRVRQPLKGLEHPCSLFPLVRPLLLSGSANWLLYLIEIPFPLYFLVVC